MTWFIMQEARSRNASTEHYRSWCGELKPPCVLSERFWLRCSLILFWETEIGGPIQS